MLKKGIEKLFSLGLFAVSEDLNILGTDQEISYSLQSLEPEFLRRIVPVSAKHIALSRDLAIIMDLAEMD
jgi:hypothetical protein